MSLRDRKNALEAQGFDPKNDKINGYEGLPAGKYHMLTEAISPSKFGQLSVRAQVIEGEHSGQNEFINVSLDETKRNGEPLPDFIIDRNIKTIASLAAVLGVALSDEAWDDIQEMVNEFQKGEGKQFNMDLTLKENKNNPAYPYKTYEFEEVKEDPFEETAPEIKDEDLPFGNAPAPTDADAPIDKNGERPF
ncbi:hypothetical protein [Companilactobacillus ginsenosidimutans]|uniref:hypothetical protein n=1 Tax=Companilactobacillus ginsenosidimutans TaxID=1007676 RepID=UPI000660D3B3|nr:hypothetical protein [Companilactobacillus ginsenosidimutans]